MYYLWTVINEHQTETKPMTQAAEYEIRAFWRYANALRAAMVAGDIATVREMFDEIDVLARHAESARVRQMCQPYMLPN
jgi:hypothetical protein